MFSFSRADGSATQAKRDGAANRYSTRSTRLVREPMDLSVQLKRLIVPLYVPWLLSLPITCLELPDKTTFVQLANERAIDEVCRVDVSESRILQLHKPLQAPQALDGRVRLGLKVSDDIRVPLLGERRIGNLEPSHDSLDHMEFIPGSQDKSQTLHQRLHDVLKRFGIPLQIAFVNDDPRCGHRWCQLCQHRKPLLSEAETVGGRGENRCVDQMRFQGTTQNRLVPDHQDVNSVPCGI